MAYTAHDSGMPSKRVKPKSKNIAGVKCVVQDNGYRSFLDPGVSNESRGSGQAHSPSAAAAAMTKKCKIRKP